MNLWKTAKDWFTGRKINQQLLSFFHDEGPMHVHRWSLTIGHYFLYMIESSSKRDLAGSMQWHNLPYTHWRIDWNVASYTGACQDGGWSERARGCCSSPEKAARQCIETFARLSGKSEMDMDSLIQEIQDLITLSALRTI